MPAFRDEKTRRARYQATSGQLKADRTSFDSHWSEIAENLMPRRTRFQTSDKNRGDKRNQKIINSTGRFAARTLASGLHAGLTSPARPWMKLTTPDSALAARPNVKQFLNEVTNRMLTIFGVSDLYNCLPIVYGDMGLFATAAMAILEDSDDLFRAVAYPVGSFWLGLDRRGQATTFMREFEMSVRQIVEEYGVQENGIDIDWTNISKAVKTQWDKGNYEVSYGVTWIVQPNELRDRSKLSSKYLPWSSCHFETGNQEQPFLRESGFRQFPIMCPRWDITGEDTYGTDCPGMTALGDVKQLQIMERRKGQAIAKMIDPPLTGPAQLRSQKVSLLPGDLTYVDVREGQQGLRSVHEVTLNLQHLAVDMQNVEFRIKRAFFEDLFLMMATSDPMRGEQPITAREVSERHEEKLLALGPVLERTNTELLDPLVDRVFGLMVQNNLLPDVPPELEGVDLKVEYISILSSAQKLIGVVGQDRFLQSVLGLTEVFGPAVTNKVNVSQVIDNYGDMLGVDPRLIVPTDQAEAATQQQQKAAQDAAQAEQAVNMAKTAQIASQARFAAGDSALDRMTQAAGAPSGMPA